ncbi:helix-turn-helix transcriptional regulator [Halopiger djelfimassiliensis]|uniref:helix-turn-helix transcriptional regulator n=1 Tax=Halopiger djelfimassiliensis TaxID=1293047 RepID=UPI0006782672|nr:DNA-binding protein [Halopiger djelfimassiliensis]
MLLYNALSPIEDIEFLARSEHRSAVLAALSRGPQRRADLRESIGVSQSTIGRTLRAFDERHWISRNEGYYEATPLGAFVSEGMQDLLERFETEQALRHVWQYLPDESSGFTVDLVADGVVTVAAADDPYGPVNRFQSLLDGADRVRFVGCDVALLEPCTDELRRRIADGRHTELIGPPNMGDAIRSACPEEFADAIESGTLTVHVNEELPPYGVGHFDERVAISGSDPNSGTVRVVIDIDTPEAREWANAICTTVRNQCRALAVEPAVN